MFRAPVFRLLLLSWISPACAAWPLSAWAGDQPSLRRLPATAITPSATTQMAAPDEKPLFSTQETPTIRDVQLSADGQLQGQLVDAQGAPLARTDIELSGLDGVPLTVQSDAQGHFAFQQLKGGTFLLQAHGAATPIRLWSAGTAPSVATNGVLLIATQQTVRGRRTGGSVLNAAGGRALLAIPLVIGAAAIIQKDRQDAADDRDVPSAS